MRGPPRPRQRLSLAQALTAAFVLVPACALAQGETAERQVPSVLLGGAWTVAPSCADHRIVRLELLPDHARANSEEGETTCSYAGQRQITPTRWYLDLECASGRRLHLDINLVSDGCLLIAHRPLGEACFYTRRA